MTDSVTTDLDRALHYTLLWGFDGFELRMLGESRVPNVNEEKLRRRLLETEVEVAAIHPAIFEGDVEDRASWMNDVVVLPESLTFCRRIGCSTILVSSFTSSEGGSVEQAVEPLKRLSDAAAKTDVMLAVMNEPGSLTPTGRALGELLDAVDRPNVAAAWNPAVALRAGEKAADGLRAVGARLAYIRGSDIQRSSDGAWQLAAFGSGDVGWTPLLASLRGRYDGVIAIDAFADPVKKQALRDVAWIAQAWRRG